METVDISGKFKFAIRFGLILLLAAAGAIGYAVFEHYHAFRELRIENAKVTGTMVSVRTLVNGKVSEFLFEDGDEVKAGDVIARLEVSVTEEAIQQLENTVELARANYEELKLGRWVKVPVKRLRAVQTPVYSTITHDGGGGGSANLSALEERANRMKELFEMGAVSAVQRDAAIQAYENAKISSGGGGGSYTTEGITYETTYVEEIEYVDEFQETPANILYGAENAIKQAELSLNVALQEAQETEIIAPVDGTIYYSTEIDKNLTAGEVVAKVGDSNELWLAAEVSEDTFNKIPIGKLVSYVIDGNNLTGIVIEKIAPDPVVEEEIFELGEIPSLKNPNVESEPTPENNSTENPDTENLDAENNPPAENPVEENPTPQVSENQTDAPTDTLHNDKFIVRVSLPEERDFECKPNSTTTIKIRI